MALFRQGLQGLDVLFPPFRAEARPRAVGEKVLGQRLVEQRMHAGHGVAHGHGPEGVAVIPAPNGEQLLFAGAALGGPVLQGHLDGCFHRHRAGIGEEDRPQLPRRDGDEFLRQAHGRLVGQAAEHHMGHRLQLDPDRLVQSRVVVTVNGAPPGRHAVYELAPVRQP